MENEKWGFKLQSTYVETQNYTVLLQLIIFAITLFVLQPKFVMSRKDDLHIYSLNFAKVFVVSVALCLSNYTPKIVDMFNRV